MKRPEYLLIRAPEPINKITKDGSELSGVDLANAFNDHFLSVALTSTKTDSRLSFMKPYNEHTVFLEPSVEKEIIRVFTELSNTESEDAFGLQIKPVKHVIDKISNCLAHIYYGCFLTGIFPHMQRARVAVTFKKGNRNEF